MAEGEMSEKQTTRIFEKIGLTEYQSLIISTLLKESGITAQEISSKADIPYTKIYSVLKTLEDKAYIRSNMERPKKYFALEPDELKDRLLERKERELQSLKEELDSHIDSLKTTYSGDHLEEIPVWFLSSRESLVSEVISICQDVEEEVIYVVMTVWKRMGSSKKVLKAIEDMNNRDVDMKMVVPSSVDDDAPELKNLSSRGFSLRKVDPGMISYSLVIADGRRCGLTIKRASSTKSEKGLRINNESIANTLYRYFEDLWGKGEPLEFS